MTLSSGKDCINGQRDDSEMKKRQTLSFDHTIIDGAPAARFTQRLKELIEGGYGLYESETEKSAKEES